MESQGRQAEEGVGQHDHGLPAAKTADGEKGAEGRADHQCNQACGEADPQRERDDSQ